MNNKERKKFQKELAQKNINFYFSLLEERFRPEFDADYIKEIKRLSEGFNIRLDREEKLRFCKKCMSYMTAETREIRLNSKNRTKEIICKKCGEVRRFKY